MDRYILKLDTLSVNLEDIGDIQDRGKEIVVLFGPEYVPDEIILTGKDAEMMKDHLKRADENALEFLIHLDWLKREDIKEIKDAPIQDKPLF